MKSIRSRGKSFINDICAWLAIRLSVVLLASLCLVFPSAAQEYQGFGAETPGGEGQPLYSVTNLNDSGPGSVRDALSEGNRYIVFDVAGEIYLNEPIPVLGSFVTIDGASAPAPGITLVGNGLRIHGRDGAHDVIVTGVRVRDAAQDGIQIAYDAYNIVLDHLSVDNSGDGNIDITFNSHDITVQWSILGDTLEGKNMLLKYDESRISLHHNLFTISRTRNPRISYRSDGRTAAETTVDMRNNIVANWTGGAGSDVECGAQANIVNNYFSNPGASLRDQQQAIWVKDEASGCGGFAYVEGNLSGDVPDIDDGPFVLNKVASPFSAPTIVMQDACTAANQVAANAGAQPRDAIDQRYISNISLPVCAGNVSPTLEVSPAQLDFSAAAGGSNPASETISMMASDSSALSWSAITGGSWLSLTSQSGETPSTVTVAVNSSGLAVGTHLEMISIDAPDAENSPLSIPVTLTVSPASAGPEIISPSPGSVLPGSNVTFEWTANGADVDKWRLYVGSSQGSDDIYDSGKFGSGLSETVSELPTDGRTIWVQLRSKIDGDWQSTDFQYIAASSPDNG